MKAFHRDMWWQSVNLKRQLNDGEQKRNATKAAGEETEIVVTVTT